MCVWAVSGHMCQERVREDSSTSARYVSMCACVVCFCGRVCLRACAGKAWIPHRTLTCIRCARSFNRWHCRSGKRPCVYVCLCLCLCLLADAFICCNFSHLAVESVWFRCATEPSHQHAADTSQRTQSRHECRRRRRRRLHWSASQHAASANQQLEFVFG